MNSTTCKKRYTDIPFAHRQHTHPGHCSLIHGHNWGFEFVFGADSLDSNGFVVDFGELKWIRNWLEDKFDHALVLNEKDPRLLEISKKLGEFVLGEFALAKITIVPNCGAEGLAKYVFEKINLALGTREDFFDRNVRLMEVTVFEDSKNSAAYYGV